MALSATGFLDGFASLSIKDAKSKTIIKMSLIKKIGVEGYGTTSWNKLLNCVVCNRGCGNTTPFNPIPEKSLRSINDRISQLGLPTDFSRSHSLLQLPDQRFPYKGL